MNIIQVMEDSQLFAKTFRRRLLRGDSWRNWKVFLRALFGLHLDKEAKEIFQRFTGRTDAPAQGFSEAFAIVGRRGGKSVIAAIAATFLAAFRNYDDVLAPGEVGTLMVIAADRRQARVIFNYITAFFQLPILRSMVVAQLKESISLNNRTCIEIHTCSFRATRGYTLIGVIADELAFWSSDDSANPDREVLNALRPGLATTNGLLLGISSPYAKRGALFEAYREHYGKNDSPALVWRASSRDMNPVLSAATVAQAYKRDSVAASAEYGAEFRSDIEGFLSLEAVEACTRSVREIPPLGGVNYFAFADPSGGASDSFTLAVAHVEGNVAVLDCVRERTAPFNPEGVVEEFCALLKTYRVSSVTGDRYGGEWPAEQFEKRAITYRASEHSKSELYLEFLPAATAGWVQLLDHARLKAQLLSLERRTARSGKDSVDHPPGGHDDVANAVAGVLVEALRSVMGDIFGYLEWEKAVGAGTIRVPGLQPATVAVEPPPACPECKWPHTSPLAFDSQFRCQQCGAQFRRGNTPEVVLPSRSNLHKFDGTKAVTNPRGFQQARSFWSFLSRNRGER